MVVKPFMTLVTSPRPRDGVAREMAGSVILGIGRTVVKPFMMLVRPPRLRVGEIAGSETPGRVIGTVGVGMIVPRLKTAG